MGYPPVVVVDEHDNEIGLAMLAEVWEKGLKHRTVRVMVEDEKGMILIQRRSLDMKIYPGFWDNSAAGHVDKGMTYLDAARQEVTEELGIADPELEEIGYFYASNEYAGYKMNNFSRVYRLRVHHQPIMFEPEEVREVKWVTSDELCQLVAQHPDRVGFGLREVADRYYAEGKLRVR